MRVLAATFRLARADQGILQRVLQPDGMVVGHERIGVAVNGNRRRHTGTNVRQWRRGTGDVRPARLIAKPLERLASTA